MKTSKTVYIVHGFNVSDEGRGTIDRFRPYLERAGYKVVDVDYNWVFLGRVRLCNNNLSRMLASMSEPDSIALGHSNGCALIHQATHYGARFREVVYINPALNREEVPGDLVEWCHVWHSPDDLPVKLASFLWHHKWGKMGAIGYKGNDPRVINYDKQNDYDVISKTHSDVFESGKIEYFAPEIIGQFRT